MSKIFEFPIDVLEIRFDFGEGELQSWKVLFGPVKNVLAFSNKI
jgi:hypothetical protein